MQQLASILLSVNAASTPAVPSAPLSFAQHTLAADNNVLLGGMCQQCHTIYAWCSTYISVQPCKVQTSGLCHLLPGLANLPLSNIETRCIYDLIRGFPKSEQVLMIFFSYLVINAICQINRNWDGLCALIIHNFFLSNHKRLELRR